MTQSDEVPPIVLEPAREEDLALLMPLVRQFYALFSYPFDEARKSAALVRLIRDRSLGRIMLVRQGGTALGYVLVAFSFSLEFDGPIAFVDELYLAPAARGKGAGSQVLALVERLCAGLGIRAVRLETEAYNNGATALYARLGYHDHGRHLMSKRLDGAAPPAA